jgi:Tfp pilus assembly protein PilF
MRAACFTVLALATAACCCAMLTAQEPSAARLYVKFGGGEVRDGERVIGNRDSLEVPLAVVEERQDAIRVTLKDGGQGWVRRSEIGTLEEVLKDASRQIAERPDDVELRLFRVNHLIGRNARGNREQALADLTQVVRLAPKDTRGYLLRGSLWAKSRQFPDAIDDFSACLRIDPACAPALLERGLARYALSEFEAALEDFETYVPLEPKAPLGYTGRAMAHVELAQYEQAEADFSRALAADDKSPLPWFERARMWMRRHDAPSAVRDLGETLKRDPKHLDAMIFLATLLACGPDETPRDGKRAIELASAARQQTGGSDFRAVEALAAAHAEAGDFPRAIEEQEQALTILDKAGATGGAKAAARQRLSQYKASRPVRLMR